MFIWPAELYILVASCFAVPKRKIAFGQPGLLLFIQIACWAVYCCGILLWRFKGENTALGRISWKDLTCKEKPDILRILRMLKEEEDFLKEKLVFIYYFVIIGLLPLRIKTKQVFVVDIVVLVVNNMTRQQTDFLVTVTVQSPPCHHSWKPHSPIHRPA